MRAVISGVALIWPDGFEDRYRGEGARDTRRGRDTITTPAYIVDLTAPLERDVFCAGQEHKLRAVTQEEAKCGASPITSQVALAMLREGKISATKPVSIAQAKRDRDAEAPSELAASIPEPKRPVRAV